MRRDTAQSPRPAAVIVLAAGGGTRMKSATPKVLHTIGGRSLLGHALAAAAEVEPDRLAVVVGSDAQPVAEHARAVAPSAEIVVQPAPLGTGDAVRIALAELSDVHGDVVVTYGDVPLLAAQTLRDLLARHRADDNAVTILTATVFDPSGYGRIVRDDADAVVAIVEDKDATDEQRAVHEINSGIAVIDAAVLRECLGHVGSDNAAREVYLTDTVSVAYAGGHRVGALSIDDVWQTEGVNTREQLAALGAELNRRTLSRWMAAGVEIVDPLTTWVDVTVELAPDVSLKPGVQLHGTTKVERGATIGPDTTLTDVFVGTDATIVRAHGRDAVVGAHADVGPFAYLRPGTVLGDAGKIGTFVETKNAEIGAGAKVPHLTYVGDAEIGEGANIGAGTIFANYDGVEKHRTVVGEQVRGGSGNVFVAPVEIGDGAATGAGTVVRRNVPPGALAVSTGPQRHVDGWVQRKRPGSAAARAAEAALPDSEADA
jgi:bifunctional UDP-N-acetylglucosamine pyrophosphorylase/glucosamine-1-phosphate N-acetyltransferase